MTESNGFQMTAMTQASEPRALLTFQARCTERSTTLTLFSWRQVHCQGRESRMSKVLWQVVRWFIHIRLVVRQPLGLCLYRFLALCLRITKRTLVLETMLQTLSNDGLILTLLERVNVCVLSRHLTFAAMRREPLAFPTALPALQRL